MRIIIASDLYQPVINGVATFSRNLAEGLAQRGHTVMVVAPSQTGRHYEEIVDGYRITRTKSVKFPLSRIHKTLRLSLSPAREIRALAIKFKPDVIHAQTPLGIGFAARSVGKKMGVPVVATNHAMPENIIDNFKVLAPISRQISYILKEIAGRFYINVDYVTMPTQAAIDMFSAKVEGASVPVKAISNGINLNKFKPASPSAEVMERFGIPTGKQVVLYTGRLDGEKHLSVLLKAMWHIKQSNRNVHLLIVGNGNDRDSLLLLAKELDIESETTFTGRVSDKDLQQLYHCGTVFAMPSPAELQSLVMLEAMSSGLPVVGVNAGALYELCQDKRNGLICEVDNDADMACKLLKILDDAELRKVMSRESVVIAKQHDISHTLDQFEAVYREVLSR